jgi:hypothetical protein
MLYAIHSQTAQMTYKGGQKPMLHLVTTAQKVEARGLACVFSDRHAVLDYTQFFTNLTKLKTLLDWKAIRANSWGNTLENPDRKERKQAEFLVHEFLPWDFIGNIGVYDSSIETRVRAIIAGLGLNAPPVTVRPDWYY